jgi:hypothetical protein
MGQSETPKHVRVGDSFRRKQPLDSPPPIDGQTVQRSRPRQRCLPVRVRTSGGFTVRPLGDQTRMQRSPGRQAGTDMVKRLHNFARRSVTTFRIPQMISNVTRIGSRKINQSTPGHFTGEPAVRTLRLTMRTPVRTPAWKKMLLAFYIAQAALGAAIGLAVPWIVWFQS